MPTAHESFRLKLIADVKTVLAEVGREFHMREPDEVSFFMVETTGPAHVVGFDGVIDVGLVVDTAIATIYAAMREPSEDVLVAGCRADDILGALTDWRSENATTREAVARVHLAMLDASPLNPEATS